MMGVFKMHVMNGYALRIFIKAFKRQGFDKIANE